MAEALLLQDMLAVEADLRLMTTGLQLTQGTWDALVSLSFNLRGGPRAQPIRAAKLWRSVKDGKRELVAELLNINTYAGQQSRSCSCHDVRGAAASVAAGLQRDQRPRGLLLRRRKEMALPAVPLVAGVGRDGVPCLPREPQCGTGKEAPMMRPVFAWSISSQKYLEGTLRL